MRTVGAYEAKTHLPRLLDEVAAGETITITKHGVPVATLSPVATNSDAARAAAAALRRFRRMHRLDGVNPRPDRRGPTTVIVVDASVTLAWCLADEADEYAERLLERVVDEGAAAPAHWPLEVANGILSAEKRGRIQSEEVGQVARLVDGLGIEVVPVELTTAMWGVLETARELGLSIYDAAYVDLARFRGVPLATLDAPLKAAAQRAGVKVVD